MLPAKTWTRRFVSGLIAGQIMLAALAVATPSHAATVLNKHGVWEGIVELEDGVAAYGAMTEMQRGGAAAFVVKDGSLSLMLTDPDWRLKPRAAANVTVEIDGQTFTGQAVVSDRQTIEIADVSTEVLKMFVDGSQAEINVNDGDIVWTLDLTGFTASMSDAIRTIKASY